MIELGDFSPAKAIGPTADLDVNGAPTGITKTGRLTTTQEQRREAVDFIVARIRAAPQDEQIGRARIQWARHPSSILEVRCHFEHLNGKRMLFPTEVVEYTESGSEIPNSAERAAAELIQEVADLDAKGAL